MCQDQTKPHPVEFLAPDGPHKTIHIADELAAPIADLAAFKEQLSAFTREDYDTFAPYDLLVSYSQFA